MKHAILIASVFLASCSGKNPYIDYQQYANGTVVNYHEGGNVRKVYQEISDMQSPRMIKGTCASACTIAFKYPYTCVFLGSKAIFHAVWNQNRTVSYAGTLAFLNQMPSKLKAYLSPKLLPNGVYSKMAKRIDYTISGHDLINKFGIKQC